MHAFKDMYRCLHFTDDWDEEDDDEEWDNIYLDEKYEGSPDSAYNRRKYGDVEDAFNKR